MGQEVKRPPKRPPEAVRKGERLWCAYDQVRKVNGKSVTVPKPAPAAGMRSIEQEAIARWPSSVDIDLGAL